MATNWVDEVKSGATSTGSKALSLADTSALTISNTSSDTLFQVKSDTTNGGFTSILGIEGQEGVLFLGADNGDDTSAVWQIQSDTSGNFKIGNRTLGTGSPVRGNTITDAITIDTSRNISVGVDDTGYDVKLFGDTASRYWLWDTSADGVVQRGTLTVGVDDTGHDVKFFGATSGQYMLWDESADELVLAGDSKLSFHDAAGGENIIATSDGHLEINAGTTLDITAPTVDVNASSELNIDGNVDLNGTLDVSGTLTLGNLTVTEGSDGASSRKLTVGNVEIDYDGTSDACGVLTFKEGDASFGTDRDWNIHQRKSSGNEGDLWVEYLIHGGSYKQPFKISATAGDDALVVGANGNISIAGDLTVTGADLILGADADGTDRTIVFGHSTLKSIMGIDDSADRFVINTDASFDGTIADNDFSIDASGNAYIKGDLTVTGGKLTFGNGEVFTNETDDVLYLEAPTVGVNAVAHSRNALFALIADTDSDSELRFMEGSNNKWAIGHDASASDELCWMQNAAINESTAKMKLTTSGDLSITGDLTVGGNDINFGNAGKITDGNGSFIFEDTDGSAGCVIAVDTQNAGQDSSIGFQENGVIKWVIGNDGSDSDKLKIASSSAALHTNTELSLDDSGNLTTTGAITSGAEIIGKSTMTTDTTAGANTWSAAELIGGMLLRDPAGGDRSDVTPTATQIVNAISDCAVGSSFRFHIRNTADANETITLTAGTDVTLSGTMTIAENYAKDFLAIVTNVGSPAVTIHSLGTYVW